MLFAKASGEAASSALLPKLAPKLIWEREEGRLSDEPIRTLRCRPRYDVRLAGDTVAGDIPGGHGSSEVPLGDRCPGVANPPPYMLVPWVKGDKPEAGRGLVDGEWKALYRPRIMLLLVPIVGVPVFRPQ